MRTCFLIIVLSGMIIFNSCITSLHPLATYDTVVKEPRIIGQWKTKDYLINVDEVLNSPLVKTAIDPKKQTTAFSGLDKNDSLFFSRSYIFTYEKNQGRYGMVASLIRLNNELFADIIPAHLDSVISPDSFGGFKDMTARGDWCTTHSFAKVNFITNKRLELQFIGGDFFLDQLEKGHIAIKYEEDELFDTSLITASTSDMQKFLIKYCSDDRIYDKDKSIILEKQ